MRDILLRYATPLITALFIVSLISGVALFFHWGNGLFNAMHEWLSMVLIFPFVLHLWRNWKPLVNYFKRIPMVVSVGLALIAALGFALMPRGTNSGPPQIAFANAIASNPVREVAPLLGESPEQLVERLRAAGFNAAEPGLALDQVASQSGKDVRSLFRVILPQPAQP